jgi:hypothetical protein
MEKLNSINGNADYNKKSNAWKKREPKGKNEELRLRN